MEADAPEILAIKVSEWKALDRVNVLSASESIFDERGCFSIWFLSFDHKDKYLKVVGSQLLASIGPQKEFPPRSPSIFVCLDAEMTVKDQHANFYFKSCFIPCTVCHASFIIFWRCLCESHLLFCITNVTIWTQLFILGRSDVSFSFAQAQRSMAPRCGCELNAQCVMCSGRTLVPAETQHQLPLLDRLAQFDPCIHPILSFSDGNVPPLCLSQSQAQTQKQIQYHTWLAQTCVDVSFRTLSVQEFQCFPPLQNM